MQNYNISKGTRKSCQMTVPQNTCSKALLFVIKLQVYLLNDTKLIFLILLRPMTNLEGF